MDPTSCTSRPYALASRRGIVELATGRASDVEHVGGVIRLTRDLQHPGPASRLAATDGALSLELIADLAGRFVTSKPEALDEVLVDGLRQIAEALQLDQATLWRKSPADPGAVPSHYWLTHPQASLPEPSYLVRSALESGQAIWIRRVEEVSGLRSLAVVPVAVAGAGSGERSALAFCSRTEREWPPALVEHLRLVSGVFGQAMARKTSLTSLERALDEVRLLRERLTRHDQQARSSLSATPYVGREEALEGLGTGAIVGRSAAIHRVLEQARQVAATDSTVLLLGETGSGKELVAAEIHALSARRARAMVRVNCSAIPSALIESELFGREKGAFTGALARQIGRFELADRSTIFLDEIGDLPLDVQVKLLRVLEERQVERLGSPRTIPVDVRIIAATHRNLEKRIGEEAFREDLFYRLNVFPIEVPPLRARTEDIPLLVWRFVDEFSKSFGKRIDAIPGDNMAALQRYAWPGNIRELRNVVERAMIVATSTRLTISVPIAASSTGTRSVKLSDVEKEHIRGVLESTRWRIRGAGGAAERLGLPPTTLETRMARLGVTRPAK